MSVLKRKIITLFFIILFIILAPTIVFYAIGNVLGDGWNILPTGGIFLKSMETGANLFINEKKITTISFFSRDYYIKNLKPGLYSVLVQKDGYNEWNNKIKVFANRVTESNVFILPSQIIPLDIEEEIEIEQISGTTTEKIYKINPKYEIAVNIFDDSLLFGKYISVLSTTTGTTTKYALGTKENPIKNRHMLIWAENKQVFFGWSGSLDSSPRIFCTEYSNNINCTKELIAYSFESQIRNLDFFPGESEICIVAVGNNIYAVEAERNPDKKLQIIYSGNEPDFRVFNDLIYIKEGNLFKQIEI